MPNPIKRDSLTTNLEKRYASQHVGGAFDAKNITTKAGTIVTTETTLQDKTFRDGGFEVKETSSGFKDVENGNSSLSSFLKGFSNKKYNG